MKPGARLVITIIDDGTITFKEYDPKSRKVKSVYQRKCSVADYEVLCERIENCIRNADRLDFYDDDASEELKIFHRYGRVQIMDRGLGNEDSHIGEIMHDFLNEVFLYD